MATSSKPSWLKSVSRRGAESALAFARQDRERAADRNPKMAGDHAGYRPVGNAVAFARQNHQFIWRDED